MNAARGDVNAILNFDVFEAFSANFGRDRLEARKTDGGVFCTGNSRGQVPVEVFSIGNSRGDRFGPRWECLVLEIVVGVFSTGSSCGNVQYWT